MKMQLKKILIEQVEVKSQFQVNKLILEGKELEKSLKYCLSKFTEGILDPDVAGKSPDRFIDNLQKNVLGNFSKRYIINAYDGKEIIGILVGLPQESEFLHIYGLHVAPEYRNKGVASTLLSKCINDMFIRNVREILLDVHTDNKPAYNLYKKFDFHEI
ncbi:GNAT family N-acetyltransferase [Clostridium hydrogeniformans]|uniref:GNAT family N-acetyltransferase n=1 Tax=Clostridium hydrogeniformans TaxID=349933 RepID=UPI0004851E48|nr:GNAT family N-acetyltransferase [Clostridium hydrogeniformans]